VDKTTRRGREGGRETKRGRERQTDRKRERGGGRGRDRKRENFELRPPEFFDVCIYLYIYLFLGINK
jgi:hypothetical protein